MSADQDIESIAAGNNDFRRVLFIAGKCHVVVMSLKPQQNIGAQVHKLDQLFRVQKGHGEAEIEAVRTAIQAGCAVIVPAGARHNITNTGSEPLKLYLLHAPPKHRDGVVHPTRADAKADAEHFDGKTSESGALPARWWVGM